MVTGLHDVTFVRPKHDCSSPQTPQNELYFRLNFKQLYRAAIFCARIYFVLTYPSL